MCLNTTKNNDIGQQPGLEWVVNVNVPQVNFTILIANC